MNAASPRSRTRDKLQHDVMESRSVRKAYIADEACNTRYPAIRRTRPLQISALPTGSCGPRRKNIRQKLEKKFFSRVTKALRLYFLLIYCKCISE